MTALRDWTDRIRIEQIDSMILALLVIIPVIAVWRAL